MIEFIYAIVGIVWLTQYYTSCNDLTAKNVTLGMSASPWGRRDGIGFEKRQLRHHQRESFCKGTGQRGWPPSLWSATYLRGPWTEGAAAGTGLSRATVEGPSASHGNLQSRLLGAKAGPWPRSWLREGAATWWETEAGGGCTLLLGARNSHRQGDSSAFFRAVEPGRCPQVSTSHFWLPPLQGWSSATGWSS